MVTIVDAREAIYTYFLANFSAVPSSRIDAANEEFDPPDGLPWVRLNVRHLASQQESLGGVGQRKFFREGSVFVSIYIPENDGLQNADTIANAVRTILEGVHLNNNDIRLNTCTITEIGLVDGWFLVQAETSFNYTETR